ncbi:acyl carrier protein [bacterium]|nr:acyl carrier protein [bacterium]
MEIKDSVYQIVANVLEISPHELHDDSAVGYEDNWDSIHHLKIISGIEEQLDISFDEDNLFELTTLGSIVTEVEKILVK